MRGLLGDESGVCLSWNKTNASQASRGEQEGETERKDWMI